MKKAFKIGPLIIIAFVAFVFITTYSGIRIGRIVEISALFIIASFIILFELKEIDSRTIAVLATLSALGGVMRVPFAALPGIQPVTFLCAVSGYTLGPVNGFMVGAMCAFISNFFLGHGPWTLWQMMGWGLCGVFFGVLKKVIKKMGIKGFVILCGLWGYIYGTILNQWFVLEFMGSITLKTIISGNVLSFPHDTMHSIGNVIFSCVFGKNFIEVLERYNKRNKIVRIKDKKVIYH